MKDKSKSKKIKGVPKKETISELVSEHSETAILIADRIVKLCDAIPDLCGFKVEDAARAEVEADSDLGSEYSIDVVLKSGTKTVCITYSYWFNEMTVNSVEGLIPFDLLKSALEEYDSFFKNA